MTQCPYYYYTWTNAMPRRCCKEEGHEGEHKEEIPVWAQPQPSVQFTGWRKH